MVRKIGFAAAAAVAVLFTMGDSVEARSCCRQARTRCCKPARTRCCSAPAASCCAPAACTTGCATGGCATGGCGAVSVAPSAPATAPQPPVESAPKPAT
ncbi:MAG: hypothetical protein JWP89_6418 [Schlesneria sp.]|nr:hypothetical protein [Schlesneria sp.]